MSASTIFLMRAGMGILFAYLVVRVFYPGGGLLAVAGFAVFFVGLAYMLEYLRRKRAENEKRR